MQFHARTVATSAHDLCRVHKPESAIGQYYQKLLPVRHEEKMIGSGNRQSTPIGKVNFKALERRGIPHFLQRFQCHDWRKSAFAFSSCQC